jgi:hypothetical protein
LVELRERPGDHQAAVVASVMRVAHQRSAIVPFRQRVTVLA